MRHSRAMAALFLLATAGFANADGIQISKVAGDNQTKEFLRSYPTLGMKGQVFDPLAVKVTGADGKPLANVPVQFTCPANAGYPGTPSCAMTLPTHQRSTVANTNAEGVATLNQYQGNSAILYREAGTVIISASTSNVSTTFTLIAKPNPAPSSGVLKIVSGDKQTLTRTYIGKLGAAYNGAAIMDPIVVALLDSAGKPIPGISVCPMVKAGSIQTTVGGCASTNAEGKVTFNGYFWSGTGTVAIDIVADRVESPGTTGTSTTVVIVEPTDTLKVTGGDQQSIYREVIAIGSGTAHKNGAATAKPITLLLLNARSQPMAGINVCPTVKVTPPMKSDFAGCRPTNAEGKVAFEGKFIGGAGNATIDFAVDKKQMPGFSGTGASATVSVLDQKGNVM